MEEKNELNELNDIILNKGRATGGNKKIVLAIATLGVILIIVVMLMNSLTSNGTENLPQAILPPEPKAKEYTQPADEPLFEEVDVVHEDSNQTSNNLDQIAQKLKQESQGSQEDFTEVVENEPAAAKPEVQEVPPKALFKKVEAPKKAETPKFKATGSQALYVQVGSFSITQPSKRLLKAITDRGYNYKYNEITVHSKTTTKILVGPFATDKEARSALTIIRKNIESGAFITKM